MFIDINVLQTMPASNPNRDDTGSPKTAMYGGGLRHRVSSQSWKHVMRKEFTKYIPEDRLALRTARATELILDAVLEKYPNLEESKAVKIVEDVFTQLEIKLDEKSLKYKPEGSIRDLRILYFISKNEINEISDVIVEAVKNNKKPSLKNVREALSACDCVDVALFGRMVATKKANLNIDASCQVAHALSTHVVENEFDYFTALDDVKEASEDIYAPGAGMIDSTEFVSSCLYRFATVNVDQLENNLGSRDDAEVAVAAFLKAFVRSLPGGKINAFANHSLPSAVYVSLREDQPISLVGAFETPVRAGLEGGYVQGSAQKLVEFAENMYRVYGAPVKAWTCVADGAAAAVRNLGPDVDVETLVSEVTEAAFAKGE